MQSACQACALQATHIADYCRVYGHCGASGSMGDDGLLALLKATVSNNCIG